MNKESLKRIGLRVFIGIYLILGIYTELGLMEILPLKQHLLADFLIYERAAREAVQGNDPYLERRIGTAFVYPPQSLLFFEAFKDISDRTIKAGLFAFINVGLLIYMVYGTLKHYGVKQSQAWFFYPLALGFAPFLELLHVGQVNQFIEFGLFLMFTLSTQNPWLAGFGLGWATMLKVTPVVFVFYLAAAKNWKAIFATMGVISTFTVIAWLRYGTAPFLNYVEAFRSILGQFPEGLESHSLFAILNRYSDIGNLASVLQKGLNIYLLVIIASGLVSYYIDHIDLFFVTLGLGVAMTPNLLWYHHYVFLLLPLFVLMCWSRLNPRVLAWCLFGFIIIQMDRFYLTAGLLIHIFAHSTIIALLIYQARLARKQYRSSNTLPV